MELKQEKQAYEMPYQLTYYECDDTGHPTMSMMLSMMTMVSDAHCISLGMDTATIQQTGGAWVITEYDGEVAADSRPLATRSSWEPGPWRTTVSLPCGSSG